MKTCSRCGYEKPLDDFNRQRGSSDGRRPECKECRNAARRKHYRENAHLWAERWAENRDALSARRAERRAERRDEVNAQQRAYIAANQHVTWLKNYRRRAQRLGVPVVDEHFTKADVTAAYGDACHYCGGEFQELDHYIPIKDAGPHVLANVRPSCTSCNAAKNAMCGGEFLSTQCKES